MTGQQTLQVQEIAAMPVSRRALACLNSGNQHLGAIGSKRGADAMCEPDKAATKYSSLAGKTIKIGADPTSPPMSTTVSIS